MDRYVWQPTFFKNLRENISGMWELGIVHGTMGNEKFEVMEDNMIVVSTNKGDFSFQSEYEVLKFIQATVQKNDEIWVSGKEAYPCIAVCINGNHATVNYFQNDAGDMWLSYNEKNQEEVIFMAGGEEWEPDVHAIISIKSAFSCVREFCTTYERPSCIQWQEI